MVAIRTEPNVETSITASKKNVAIKKYRTPMRNTIKASIIEK